MLRTTLCAVMLVSSLAYAGDYAATQAANQRAIDARQHAREQQLKATLAETSRRANADQAARDANWQRIQNSWKAQQPGK